jgi:hypothetical protein
MRTQIKKPMSYKSGAVNRQGNFSRISMSVGILKKRHLKMKIMKIKQLGLTQIILIITIIN